MWSLLLAATTLLATSGCYGQLPSEPTEAPRQPWNRYDDRDQEFVNRDRDREATRDWDSLNRDRDVLNRDRENGLGFGYRPTSLQNDNVIIKEA
jgi:hypothetical protein